MLKKAGRYYISAVYRKDDIKQNVYFGAITIGMHK